jgi:hypothetical protein
MSMVTKDNLAPELSSTRIAAELTMDSMGDSREAAFSDDGQAAVGRLVKLLQFSRDAEPPADLLQRTLARVSAASRA